MVDPIQRNRRRLAIALVVVAVSPTFIGLIMFFVTPTYFRPMFENVVSLVLLGILVGAVGAGYAVLRVAVRLFRNRSGGFGFLVLAVYAMFWGFALWIVLIGPAILILLQPRSG